MDNNPIAQFLANTDTKFYLALGSALWASFKGFNWVRDIRDKDLKGIKEDLGAQTVVLKGGLDNISDGLRELRSDFRTFYTSPDPLMIPVNARTTRKRKSVVERSIAKARKPAANPAVKKTK